MRILILVVVLSAGATACSDDLNGADLRDTEPPISPPASTTTTRDAEGTTTTSAVDEAPLAARQPDVWGWLERYDLTVPTTVEYPVVTVSPELAPGKITVDGRTIDIDAETAYIDNCLIILNTVRSPPGSRGPGFSRGCYVLAGVAADGSAEWVVAFWSEGVWEPTADGMWQPSDPIDTTLPVGRLVGFADGLFVLERGAIRYALPGRSDIPVGSDCPSLDDPDFFAVPTLHRSVDMDTLSGSVVGVRCEFEYSD